MKIKNYSDAIQGTGAIEAISERLQQELPGLRGFSARNVKSKNIRRTLNIVVYENI